MAGVVGTAAQWGRFQISLDKLKKRYGFRVFHAKEFKARSGEFSGWPPAKCLALISDLSELTGQGLMHGAVLSIKNAEYEEYYKNGERPKKLRLDTCYALGFRLCFLNMVDEIMRRLGHDKRFERTRLHVVLESGHKNSGDAARAFHEEMKSLQSFGCDLLAGMTLADKTKCDPLMVSDFLAHTAYMRGEDGFPPLLDEDLRSTRQKTTLTHLGFDPGGVAEYKAAFVKQWESKRRRLK